MARQGTLIVLSLALHGALAAALVLLVGVAPFEVAAAGAGDGALVVRYRSPAPEPLVVARAFDRPAARWAAGHRGVDLTAAVGDVVVAPAGGLVTVAGTVVDRGVVTIRHADGRRSSLEPVTPSVAVGEQVAAGQRVGTLAAGRWHCSAACLHWGVREGTDYVDPIALLPGLGPVVLLPVP